MTPKASSPKSVIGDPILGSNGFPTKTFGNDDCSAHATLKVAEGILSQVGFDNPELEARFLLSGLLQVPLTDFFANPDRALTDEQRTNFQSMVNRRCQKEPVSYIVGWHQFMGVKLQVDNRALIPRPETEILVERAAYWLAFQKANEPVVLDVGTGSGCIALALAHLFPKAQITALDISEKALGLAVQNAAQNQQISFVQSDLFSALGPEKHGVFDMIASNPPYISHSELGDLEKDVTYEPLLALDGGKDGLHVLSRLIKDAPKFLKKNGLLIVEIGYKQGLAVERLFLSAGFKNVEVVKDYQGHDRIVKGEASGSV